MAEICHIFFFYCQHFSWLELEGAASYLGGKHTAGWFWFGAEGTEWGWLHWASYSNRLVGTQGSPSSQQVFQLKQVSRRKSHLWQRLSAFPQGKDTLDPFKKSPRFILHGFPLLVSHKNNCAALADIKRKKIQKNKHAIEHHKILPEADTWHGKFCVKSLQVWEVLTNWK